MSTAKPKYFTAPQFKKAERAYRMGRKSQEMLDHEAAGGKIEFSYGSVRWLSKSKRLHRVDGPARQTTWVNEWYRHGYLYKKQYGSNTYHLDRSGRIHKDDGPAVVSSNGKQEWWIDGQRHRDNGPAVVSSNGTIKYYQNGKLHREDGPAVVDKDGTEKFYLEGKKVPSLESQRDFDEVVKVQFVV